MVLVLHQSGVSHGHSHGPQQHQRQGRCNHENASVRAAFVHVLGDLVQSVGVLVAAAIIHFWVCVRGTFMCSERWQLRISRNDNLLLYFWLLCSSQPEYKAADPICTFLFSALVLGTTVPVTKDVFRILMEGKKALLGGLLGRVSETKGCLWAGTPRDVRVDSVRTQLLSVSGVTDVHSLHVWSLNMTHALLSVHVTAGRPTHVQDRGITLPFNWNPAD